MKKRNLYDINDWADIERCLKIGEILLMAGKVTERALTVALDLQKTRSEYVGQILLSLNAITEEDLEAGLALQAEINPRCRFDLVLSK